MVRSGIWRAGRGLAAAGLALGLLAGTARAVEEDAAYRITISGIPAGELTMSGQSNGGRYTAQATMQTTGLVGTLYKVYFEGRVAGAESAERLSPSQYVGRASNGRVENAIDIRYAQGRPTSVQYLQVRGERDYELDPETQKDTVDPMTAAYWLLRRVKSETACGRSVDIFDGGRRSVVSIKKPTVAGEKVTCEGVYTRVGGFPPSVMEKRKSFPFTLEYRKAEDGMLEVERFSTQTIFGTANVTRR